MKARMGQFASVLAIVFLFFGALSYLHAADASFHHAPASVKALKNPTTGQAEAVPSGARAYAQTCAKCHGERGQGTGNVPSLADGPTQTASDGEVFWFITKGDINNGMPSWKSLPRQHRWAIVSFLKTLPNAPKPGAATSAPVVNHAPAADKTKPQPTQAPFTDYRFEEPGNSRKITMKDLPEPFATKSSSNGPSVVPRPQGAWPKAPAGFKVELYATDLDNPRLITTAPGGDYFVAESDEGRILVFRGITADGKPQQTATFASGLRRPYGIAFYPPGPNPQWVYIGNTDAVVRFAYQNGDLKARASPEHIADLPRGGGHYTRSVQFSPDGKKMFVAVGSASNVDDPDTSPAEKNRADILEFNPDGSGMRIYAYGIRNAGGGLAVNQKTGELWCSVNERDGLGDNLVPDYITHVQDGGFYGWPWWYMGEHQDPRHKGKHPEFKDKVITPDVPLQPHTASLQLTFYDGKQFPADFQGDIFASEHGSWNKSIRVGYEVIRIPLHQTGQATGEYEDFLTGFVVDNDHVWGRPVGVTVATDGSLLVTDDASSSIWRVRYVGK